MYPPSTRHLCFIFITLSLLLAGCQSQPTTSSKVTIKPKPTSPTITQKSEKSAPIKNTKKSNQTETSSKAEVRSTAKVNQADDSANQPTAQVSETIAPPVITNPPVRKRLPSQLIFEDLISRADQARKQKQWPQAATLYQQAQQLKPKRTVSYARLSEVSLAQNNPTDAEDYARKGLKVAKSRSQKRGFWALIALSLEKQGKSAEAAQARAELAKLR